MRERRKSRSIPTIPELLRTALRGAAVPPFTSAAARAWPRAGARAGAWPGRSLRCGGAALLPLPPSPQVRAARGGGAGAAVAPPPWRPQAGWAAAWPPSGWRWLSTRWAWRCCWPACSPTCSSPTCSSTQGVSASSSASFGGCSGTRATWRYRWRSCGTTWGWRRPRIVGTACCGGWCTASATASPPPFLPRRDPALRPPTWSCSVPGARGAAPPSPAGPVEDTIVEVTDSKSGGSAANCGKIPSSMP